LGVIEFIFKNKIPYFEVKVGFCTYFPYFAQELTQKSRVTNPGNHQYLKNCLILPWISCKPVLQTWLFQMLLDREAQMPNSSWHL
jgi:hypothetical protein